MTASDYNALDSRNFDDDINAPSELERQLAALFDGYRDGASSHAGGSIAVRRAIDEARIASLRRVGQIRNALYDSFKR